MKGLPLLIASVQPMLGPMVPTLGRIRKIRVQGMGHGDQVSVYGHGETQESELLHEFEVDIEVVDERLKDFKYLQAQRTGDSRQAIHVWVE